MDETFGEAIARKRREGEQLEADVLKARREHAEWCALLDVLAPLWDARPEAKMGELLPLLTVADQAEYVARVAAYMGEYE